jgi:hypothetical protein
MSAKPLDVQARSSEISGDTAVVFGATGACGKHLVASLLDRPEISKVYCFTRRTTTKHMNNPKYCEVLLINETNQNEKDIEKNIAEFKRIVTEKFPPSCDVVFSGLATTIGQCNNDYDLMWSIDYNMNDIVATHARQLNVPQYYLISATNGSENSWFFYPRLKGTLDSRIEQLQFPRSVIYQPGLLIGGDRPEARAAEGFMEKWVAPLSFWQNGWFPTMRPIQVKDVGEAMCLDYIANRGKNSELKKMGLKYQPNDDLLNMKSISQHQPLPNAHREANLPIEHKIYVGSQSILDSLSSLRNELGV